LLVGAVVAACSAAPAEVDSIASVTSSTTTLFTQTATDPWGLALALAHHDDIDAIEFMEGAYPPYILTKDPMPRSHLESFDVPEEEQLLLAEWLEYLIESDNLFRLFDPFASPEDYGSELEVRWEAGDLKGDVAWVHVCTYRIGRNEPPLNHILVAGKADGRFAGIIWADTLSELDLQARAAAERARNG
jgi:hypothetical protein